MHHNSCHTLSQFFNPKPARPSRVSLRSYASFQPGSHQLRHYLRAHGARGCMYCGQASHLSSKSQGSPVVKEILVSPTVMPSPQPQRPQLQAWLLLPGRSQSLSILIDSGGDAWIIDKGLVQQLGLKQGPLPHPIPAWALDGHVLETVSHQTATFRQP